MTYLDTSVVLAELLAEDRHPDPGFWQLEMAASWLMLYELWSGLHRRRVGASAQAAAHELTAPVFLVALTPEVLARALEPFPVPVRTLDGLHLATMDYLRAQGHSIQLASYDDRMQSAARAMGFALTEF